MAQLFVGTKSLVSDVYGMRFKSQFVNSLQDVIRERGAPTKLISDSAKEETSNKVKEILRYLMIPAWQSEPYHQHQNPAERRYQFIKETVNCIMDRTGSPPPELWLHAMKYVCYLLNHTSSTTLDDPTPLQVLLGSTPDISELL